MLVRAVYAMMLTLMFVCPIVAFDVCYARYDHYVADYFDACRLPFRHAMPAAYAFSCPIFCR